MEFDIKPRGYDFHPGDLVYLEEKHFSFDKIGDLLLVDHISTNGFVGVRASDHPNSSAVIEGDVDFIWYYPKHNFTPYPIAEHKIDLSIDSVLFDGGVSS